MKTVKSISRVRNGQHGMVLIVCLIILLMLALIGIASITNSNSDLTIAGNELSQTGAFYAAEAGIEQAVSDIQTHFESTGRPPDPLPSGELTLNSHRAAYAVTADGLPAMDVLTSGSYAGLQGLVRNYEVTSTGYSSANATAVELNVGVQDALIPLFQFAVFYENDLEISPGAAMTLGGRVHSNANTYLQSDIDLFINSYLTSGGNILHGRKPGGGSVSNGNVNIMDGDGVYQNMRNIDGSFLDSRDDDWVNSSLLRWGGNVEDRDHGITNLYMPVVTDGPPTDLIDRAAGNSDSFENQAGLKFVDGQAFYLQLDGSWLNVTAPLLANGSISLGTFHDSREGRDVNSLNVNVGALSSSGYFPSNGIIYASLPDVGGNLSAVRLTNGAQLPSGLTVATENPLYTQGNYNTINKKPASLIADALTFLSNNWADANSWGGLAGRSATATQVNACYMTGNTETGSDGNGYNGGLENLPRFLENWTGVSMGWRGSAVDLWYSRKATAPWSYGSYYTAPNRDWAFDIDLLDFDNLPPGTPRITLILRTSWRQRIIDEYHSPFSDIGTTGTWL